MRVIACVCTIYINLQKYGYPTISVTYKWNDHELPVFNPIISHPSITIAPYPIKMEPPNTCKRNGLNATPPLWLCTAPPHLHYERVHRVHRAQEPNRTEEGYWLLRGGGLYIPFHHENLGATLSLSLWIIRGPHFSGVLSKSSTLLTPSVPDKSSFINQFQSCATCDHLERKKPKSRVMILSVFR